MKTKISGLDVLTTTGRLLAEERFKARDPKGYAKWKQDLQKRKGKT